MGSLIRLFLSSIHEREQREAAEKAKREAQKALPYGEDPDVQASLEASRLEKLRREAP